MIIYQAADKKMPKLDVHIRTALFSFYWLGPHTPYGECWEWAVKNNKEEKDESGERRGRDRI